MAVSAKQGTLTIPTSTGNQSISGLGFQPVAVFFFATDRESDGSHVDQWSNFGFAVSSTERGAVVAAADDAGTTSSREDAGNVSCLRTEGPNGLIENVADFVSMDADGFTLNWAAVSAQSELAHWLAVGGDVTNADVKIPTSPAAAQTQATTGVGFQPDCLVVIGTGSTSAGGGANFHRLNLGFGVSATERFAVSIAGEHDRDFAKSTQVADKVIHLCTDAGGILISADIESLDSDGFTLDWTTASNGVRVIVLSLKGGTYSVGVDTQKTSTGTQATTGLGQQPAGLLLASFNKAASASVLSDSRLSYGVASGTANRGCAWSGRADADGSADTDFDSAAIIKMLTEGTPTLNAEADLSSFDADGFTLNWVTADATARQFGYLAVGDVAAGGGTRWNLAPANSNPTAGGNVLWKVYPT